MILNKKNRVWLPLIFSLVLATGMLVGYRLQKLQGNRNFFAGNSGSSLQEVIDLVRYKYVDSIGLDSLQGKAIEEIMNELDPHSVYISPAELKEANEDLAGNFEGIGIEFNIFNDTVNVVYVIPGGPGEKAGLRAGDEILAVNDTSLAGKYAEIEHVKNNIKGESGSVARLRILRDRSLLNIPVQRGSIFIPSLDAAYMLNANTGYIRLNKFSENTYVEFMQALEGLKKKGLQKLVLDLRGNGGGLMNQAVDIADEFLDGDKLIVYTQGVNSKKTEYRCKRPGLFESGELVVLTDELTASASEILCGALQDWCRAKIIGQRSFGKGLVQNQYSLSDGGAIRLTVARYYTPLGRCIQRSYVNGKKIYMDEVFNRFNNGEMQYADSNKYVKGKIYISPCKDTVYGGGGIMPDLFVPFDTTLFQPRFNDVLSGISINEFAFRYYMQHKHSIDSFASPADYVHSFDPVPLWKSFSGQISDSSHKNPFADAQKEILIERLKALIARYKWRSEGFYEAVNEKDEELRAAIKAL